MPETSTPGAHRRETCCTGEAAAGCPWPDWCGEWAFGISEGLKPIENRGNRPLCTRTLLIHAGLKSDRSAHLTFTAAGFALPPVLVKGAIVAVATIDSVCDKSRHGERVVCDCGPWAMPGQYHWHLADVRKLPEPVPVPRGQLWLWEPPADVLAAVREQLAVSA